MHVFAQIKNLNGLSAIIVVSCVSKDPPHYPHPHNLVGTNCKDGVCTIRLRSQQNTVKYVAIIDAVGGYVAFHFFQSAIAAVISKPSSDGKQLQENCCQSHITHSAH